MLTPNSELGDFNFELIKKLSGGKGWLMTDSYGNKYVISTNELNKRGGSLGNQWSDSGISSIGESLNITETHSDGMSTGLFADEEDGYNIDKENLEETKYVLKGGAPSTDSSMEDEMSLLDEPSLDEPSLDGLDDMEAEGGDKPFDDEPFDAGVEADEDTDPEKFIQQLSGKLGQSLRQYTEDEGQPDFDLEKFAVNSVLSATHTGEMDKEDQRDIINKVKNSGNEDPEDMPVDDEVGLDEPIDNEVDNEDNFDFGEEPVEESGPREYQKNQNSNVMWHDSHWGPLPERLPVGTKFSANGKRGVVLSDYMDAGAPLTYKVKYDDGTNGLVGSADPTLNILKDGVDEVDSKFGKDERWASGDERWGGGLQESEKNSAVVALYSGDESVEELPLNQGESENDMMLSNLKNMKQDADKILSIDKKKLDKKLKGMDWVDDHISTSTDDTEEVADFLTTEGNSPCWDGYERVPNTKEGEKGSCRKKTSESIQEAEYQGKTVELNKPSSCGKDCKKKFKVYVKNDKGNIVKVQFGDPNMEIRRDNPEARKSFRARHKCDQKKDKTSAGYWSCKMWSSKSVSDILQESEKNSNFVDKDNIMEASEPMVPVKPVVKPKKIRKREIDRPFSPKRKDKVNAPPKFGEFIHEEGESNGIDFNGSMVDVNTIDIGGVHMNDYPDFDDAFIASASYVDGTPLSDDELVEFQAENDMLVVDMVLDKQLYVSGDEDGNKYND